MNAFTSRLRWLALPTLALAAVTGFLHWHLAVTTAAACVLGFIFAIPRRAIVLAAVLCSPFALLALVVSTTTWHWPLFGINGAEFGDAALAFPLGFLFGGAAVCSLIPYAAARWSRSGVLMALFAWSGGLLVTASAAGLVMSLLKKPPQGLFSTPEMEATLRAMTYAEWLEFNGLIANADYFHYEGHVEMADCTWWHSHVYTARIPVDVRRDIERYTFGSLPDGLRRWFAGGGYDGDPGFPCSVTVNENPDGSVEINGACAPIEGMPQRFPRGFFQAFDLDLPTFRFQAPVLVPGKDSLMTITAPRGCIADTFPAAESITYDKATETFKLRVGFPRSGFSPLEAQHLVEKPWKVHVDLLKPVLQGPVFGSLLHALNNALGMATLFVVTAIASRTLGRTICGRIFSTSWMTTWVAYIRERLTAGVNIGRALWGLYSSRSRAFRWSLIGALGLVCAFFVLPYLSNLLLGAIFVLLDPSYWLATILFVIALCSIEIVAFIIRRVAPTNSAAAPERGSPVGH